MTRSNVGPFTPGADRMNRPMRDAAVRGILPRGGSSHLRKVALDAPRAAPDRSHPDGAGADDDPVAARARALRRLATRGRAVRLRTAPWRSCRVRDSACGSTDARARDERLGTAAARHSDAVRPTTRPAARSLASGGRARA